jgi:hypothetical protein
MINDIIWKKKAAIDQIKQGLNDPFGLASFMERNEDIPLKHIFPSYIAMSTFHLLSHAQNSMLLL